MLAMVGEVVNNEEQICVARMLARTVAPLPPPHLIRLEEGLPLAGDGVRGGEQQGANLLSKHAGQEVCPPPSNQT